MLDGQQHKRQADSVRRGIVELLQAAGGGHFGGSLSLVDVLLVIWRDFLRMDPEPRDRFVLSKGHGAPALYCTLATLGLLDVGALTGYGRDPDALPAHPEIGRLPFCDFSTGSLGQGLSAALGMALMLRESGRRVWAVLGDGECQEGQVWEAAMLAARLNVSNLIAVVDCNGRQEWGYRSGAPTPVLGLADKWRAFGWRVEEADGHDPSQLRSAFQRLADAPAEAPAILLAATIKGRGIPLIEADPDRFHCGSLDPAEFAACFE